MYTDDFNLKWMHSSGSRRQRTCPSQKTPLHRIAEVLEEERISFRSLADRMNIPEARARAESDPGCDLTLSDLHRWQAALKVPIADLLTTPGAALSPMVGLRAGLLKAMRTVRSIQVRVQDEATQLLSMMLVQQLVELMPELTHVTAWPAIGTPRTSDELGAVVDKQLPADFFDAGPEF